MQTPPEAGCYRWGLSVGYHYETFSSLYLVLITRLGFSTSVVSAAERVESPGFFFANQESYPQ